MHACGQDSRSTADRPAARRGPFQQPNAEPIDPGRGHCRPYRCAGHAQSHPHDEAAGGQLVEAGQGLGQVDGASERSQDDGDPQAGPSRQGSGVGEEGDGLYLPEEESQRVVITQGTGTAAAPAPDEEDEQTRNREQAARDAAAN